MSGPEDLLRLAGRVIVVTGAAGAIGSGIARRLTAAGAVVVAHTRATPFSGEAAAVVRADLTAPDGPRRVVQETLAACGRIDGLVNNAGIQPVADFAETGDREWAEVIDTDLTAVHRLTLATAEAMEQGGAIVHIASIEGIQPAPGHGHYAVAKAALIMHARAAASAYGSAGIRVNVVSPGLVDDGGLAGRWPQGVDRWLAAAPLGRLGTPEDVGDACVFLCSDLARWITGANLVVDGGVLTRPTW